MRLLLKNGRIIDTVAGTEQKGDILISGDKIQAIGQDLEAGLDVKVVDLEGKVVSPGFIDMHVHLREPGYEYKETIATGTKAAAVGGFTTVVAMPNTNPAMDNETSIEYVMSKAQKEGIIEVLPCAAITKGRKGDEIAEYGILKNAGAVALSDDGDTVANPEVMRRAMEYSLIFDLPILAHCEDKALSGGSMHEGYYSTILGLKGIPSLAEDVVVARDIALAEYTGARLHIAHISTAGAVEMVRAAKKKGLKVTAEVTPHHFSLTDAEVVGYNTDTKMSPPLRSGEHVEAMIAGLLDGTIDAIACDHAPHALVDKNVEYEYAAFGISGIETSVAVSLHYLYHEKQMPLMELLRKFTIGPASILGMKYEGLMPGAVANLTILDIDLTKKVDVNTFVSKGKNSPYHGKDLKGWPMMTIYKGQVVAE